MWNGKNKAITFSFDDGVEQDVRVIEIMERYGLKGTFNLNSCLFGIDASYMHGDKKIEAKFLTEDRIREVYKNQEVAAHTAHHYNLTKVDDATAIDELNTDVRQLGAIVGYPIRAMAYPSGGVNHDDRVVNLVKNHTPIRFARTTISSNSFAMQADLLRFNPTVYFKWTKDMFALAEQFLSLKTDEPQVFYIWGHTYELDEAVDMTWEKFEEFCRLISGKEDIFYGTNSQVFLDK